MTSVPLANTDWRRALSQEPLVPLVNRYPENSPSSNDTTALLCRPGLKQWLTIGDGPIRGVYSAPGAFDDALFAVSGDALFRIDTDNTSDQIGAGLFGSPRSSVSMTATPTFLWVADGRSLWLYADGTDGFATGVLTVAGGSIASGYKIQIGTVYYQWTSGSVNTGTPAGTVGAPWLVALGGTDTIALDNMRLAINDGGTSGTTYSTLVVPHPTVEASTSTATTLSVRARASGTGGNAIGTLVTSGAHISWAAATLAGGGSASFTEVWVPADAGAVSVGAIASFVIVVVAQGSPFNGRFYWLQPGETEIDPLDFATAERAPDPVWSVRVVGDQFWLFGTNTTEVWYPTGDPDAPFLRVQGRLFDRGIWESTDVQVKDAIVLVDTDGVVYRIEASPQRISDNGIEERIRNAMIAHKLQV